jgi:hypothetical protein
LPKATAVSGWVEIDQTSTEPSLVTAVRTWDSWASEMPPEVMNTSAWGRYDWNFSRSTSGSAGTTPPRVTSDPASRVIPAIA